MARILIVDDDGLVARQMARTLREAGHTLAMACNGRSALQEAAERPDVVLLDLGLPDVSGETLLVQLKSYPDTAPIPVLVVIGKRNEAAQLKASAQEWVAEVLLKPVSSVQLRQASETEEPLGTVWERQSQLVQRLIVEGSDSLVFHTSRRLSSDRTRGRGSLLADALSWSEISELAKHEGLVDAEQASLLRRILAARLPGWREGAA